MDRAVRVVSPFVEGTFLSIGERDIAQLRHLCARKCPIGQGEVWSGDIELFRRCRCCLGGCHIGKEIGVSCQMPDACLTIIAGKNAQQGEAGFELKDKKIT